MSEPPKEEPPTLKPNDESDPIVDVNKIKNSLSSKLTQVVNNGSTKDPFATTENVAILGLVIVFCLFAPFYLILSLLISRLPRSDATKKKSFYIVSFFLGLIVYITFPFLIVHAAKTYNAHPVLKKIWVPSIFMFVVAIIFVFHVINVMETRVCVLPNVHVMLKVIFAMGLFNLMILFMFMVLNNFNIDVFGLFFSKVSAASYIVSLLDLKGKEVQTLLDKIDTRIVDYNIALEYGEVYEKGKAFIVPRTIKYNGAPFVEWIDQYYVSLRRSDNPEQIVITLNLNISEFEKKLANFEGNEQYSSLKVKIKELDDMLTKTEKEELDKGFNVDDYTSLGDYLRYEKEIEGKKKEKTEKSIYIKELETFFEKKSLLTKAKNNSSTATSDEKDKLEGELQVLKGNKFYSESEGVLTNKKKEITKTLETLVKDIDRIEGDKSKFIKEFTGLKDKLKGIHEKITLLKSEEKNGFIYELHEMQMSLLKDILGILISIKQIFDKDQNSIIEYNKAKNKNTKPIEELRFNIRKEKLETITKRKDSQNKKFLENYLMQFLEPTEASATVNKLIEKKSESNQIKSYFQNNVRYVIEEILSGNTVYISPSLSNNTQLEKIDDVFTDVGKENFDGKFSQRLNRAESSATKEPTT